MAFVTKHLWGRCRERYPIFVSQAIPKDGCSEVLVCIYDFAQIQGLFVGYEPSNPNGYSTVVQVSNLR